MAIHEVQAPANYVVPNIIHSTIVDNYADVVSILWNELQDFNDPDGDTRVFCSQILLPVEYLNFYGSQYYNDIKLEFTTASEINNKGFEVQRSSDAINWRTLDFIPARTDQTTVKNYTLLDSNPLIGRNHYRIKQIDHDGRYEYSSIVTVQYNRTPSIAFYPNPAKHTLHFSRAIEANIQIFNQLGSLERSFNNPGDDIDISDLSDGIYTLRWEENEKILHEKIIIRN